jgi:hypothetical protein
LPLHYFPNIDVLFLHIYKNGCTSALSYLLALEQAKTTEEVTGFEEGGQLGLQIHHSRELSKYLVKVNDYSRMTSAHKILVLRNPYRRALSAWMDKLVYAQSAFKLMNQYKNSPFVPETIESLPSLNRAFEQFTEQLASNQDFLLSDNHWKPQSLSLTGSMQFDLVLETSHVSEFPMKLAAFVSEEKLQAVGDFPHFNKISSGLPALLGSEISWQNIEEAYKEDFALLKRFGISAPRPIPEKAPSTAALAELLQTERAKVSESRARAEVSELRRSISDMGNSKSWKLTAWLRWLDSKLTGKERNRIHP